MIRLVGRESWSRRREERDWERELLRQIRALETTDEGPDGGTVSPLPRRTRRPRRSRRSRAAHTEHVPRERRRTFATVGITLAVIVGLFFFNLSPGSSQVRSLLGLDDRLAPEVDGGSSTAFKFLATRANSGKPIGWSPCEPITYEVNPEDAPDDWEDLLGEAVATISSLTGLVFEDGGETDDRAFEDRFGVGGRPEPVLIGWATSDEVPDLDGDVAGLAGPISRSTGVIEQYVTGRVVFDADAFDDIEQLPGGDRQQRAIVLHELGHLVGLDHVDDPSQLMYPTTEVIDFGNGDRRGLALLGRTPCA